MVVTASAVDFQAKATTPALSLRLAPGTLRSGGRSQGSRHYINLQNTPGFCRLRRLAPCADMKFRQDISDVRLDRVQADI